MPNGALCQQGRLCLLLQFAYLLDVEEGLNSWNTVSWLCKFKALVTYTSVVGHSVLTAIQGPSTSTVPKQPLALCLVVLFCSGLVWF